MTKTKLRVKPPAKIKISHSHHSPVNSQTSKNRTGTMTSLNISTRRAQQIPQTFLLEFVTWVNP